MSTRTKGGAQEIGLVEYCFVVSTSLWYSYCALTFQEGRLQQTTFNEIPTSEVTKKEGQSDVRCQKGRRRRSDFHCRHTGKPVRIIKLHRYQCKQSSESWQTEHLKAPASRASFWSKLRLRPCKTLSGKVQGYLVIILQRDATTHLPALVHRYLSFVLARMSRRQLGFSLQSDTNDRYHIAIEPRAGFKLSQASDDC